MTDLTLPPDFGLGQDRTGKRLLTQCRNVDEEFLPTLVALAGSLIFPWSGHEPQRDRRTICLPGLLPRSS